MSEVKFSANPSAVLKALSDIQRALDRTAQTGRKFSELDFGNPQLARLEERMRATKAQMDAFLRVSPNSAMARGLRNSGQMGRAPWEVDWTRAFPDPQQRARALGRLAQLPHQFGGMPPGGVGYGGEQGRGGINMPGFLPQTPMGAAGALVGLALGGSIARAVSQGVERSQQVDASTDSVLRWSTVTRDFESLRKEIVAVGQEFGVLSNEGAKLAQTYAQASGSVDGAADGANTAAGLAVGAGMDRAGTAARMGSLQFAGAIGGATSQREFAGMFAEVLARGGMTSRGDQVLSELASSVEKLTSRALAPQDIATLAGFSLATYEQAKTNPGLRSVGPSGLIDVISGFTSYGSDDLQKTMMQYNALEKFTTNLGLQRRMVEAGPFGRPGEMVGSDDRRIYYEILMDEARKMTRGMDPHMAKAAMAEIVGTTTPMIESLEAVMARFPNLDLGTLADRMKGAGVDFETVGKDAFLGIAKIEAARGSAADLASIREQMIADNKIGGEEAGVLRGLSGDQLADALMKLEAQQGRSQNDFTRMADAVEKSARTFDEVGDELNKALIDLREAVVDVTEPIRKISGFWDSAKSAVDGKSLFNDGGLLSILTYSPLGAAAVDAGKGALEWAKSPRSGRTGRSGRNRRTDQPPDAAEAPAEGAGTLLDWLFKPAEASALPLPSVFDINPPLTSAQRMQRAMTVNPSAAQSAKTGARGRVLDMIAAPESKGNYDAWFSNAGQSEVDLSTMTLNEIKALQKELVKKNGGSAIGRYQIIPSTMELLKSRLGLTGDELFTDELQDRMGISLAKDAGLVGWEKGVVPDDEFAYRLSKIWAGLPKDESNESYYAGDGLNKAHVTWDSVMSDLRSAKTPVTDAVGMDVAQPAMDSTPAVKIEPPVAAQAMSDVAPAPVVKIEPPVAAQAMSDVAPATGAKAAIDALPQESEMRSWDLDPATMGADEDAIFRGDTLPKEISPVGDKVSQRIGTGLRQEPAPPISLSLSMFQNPITGAFHVEADRQGSGATRIAYGAGQWGIGRPRETS